MKNREFRSIPLNIETRASVLEDGTEELITEGYASTYEEYTLWEDEECKFFESIDRHAFDECDFSDCVFRKDHEGTVFARVSNGTLKVCADDHGLWNQANLNKTASARAMYEEVKEGMYPQMSFAFTVDSDEFTRDADGNYHRNILKVGKCYDVSPVSWPANPGTNIDARALFNGAIEKEAEECRKREKEAQLAERKRNLLERLEK